MAVLAAGSFGAVEPVVGILDRVALHEVASQAVAEPVVVVLVELAELLEER